MATLPSRKITAAFIGVFVVGVLVGWLNATSIYETRFSGFLNRTGDPVNLANRFNQKYTMDYQLSADQQAKIAPLTQDVAQRLYQLRHQFGADIISTLDDFHAKVAEQMTPDQRAAYAKANEDRKKRMTALLLSDPPSAKQGQK